MTNQLWRISPPTDKGFPVLLAPYTETRTIRFNTNAISSERMFLGLLDLDPLVRDMDPNLSPNPDPSVIKQKYKKNINFLLFCDLRKVIVLLAS